MPTRSDEEATLADLLGRRTERDAVGTLLSRARAGRSGAFVVRGEAGIGKTALLGFAREEASAQGYRIESATGMEAEMHFAFAGLHQLCQPLLERAEGLPDPQRAALDVAFGQRDGSAPDRFLVGLATLNLLAEAAEEAPLLCLIEDAHWLDEASAQVMAFVARRLVAERIALVLAMRDQTGGGTRAFAGLPELRLAGLGESDARTLLTSALHTPLDDQVRDRIVAEARGNPLALLELPLSWQPEHRAGGFGLPEAGDVPFRVEDSFRRRSGTLPTESQQLLLVAAAEPTGDVATFWRAAAQLGIARDAIAPAEAAGLVDVDSRVRFRHPLARSAVYQAAPMSERRRAHGALATVIDPMRDQDRRTWHRAHSVLGFDEEIAAELERSAERTRARGGFAAAGAFLQRSTELTPEPADRTRRALEAAHAKHEAGASKVALELLGIAESGALDPMQRARAALLHAQIAFHLTRGEGVPRMLLEAATALETLDFALAHEIYFHALDAVLVSGDATDAARIAEAVLAAPAPAKGLREVDQLVDGIAAILVRGDEEGVPLLRAALAALRDAAAGGGPYANENQPWLWLAGRMAVGIFEDDLAHALTACNIDLSRADGSLALLPLALSLRANVLIISGELSRARELTAEATAITDSTGNAPIRHARVILAAWQGDRAAVTELNDSTRRDDHYPEKSTEAALGQYALAVLLNGRGEYSAAQQPAQRACDSIELSLSAVALPELIEASVRAGDSETAALALERLSTRARASGTAWALGLEARSRALTIAGPAAEDHYLEAIARLEKTRIAGETARAHLVYGEWLRREGRRQQARDQLRTAYGMLTDMGAAAFAARAARELGATGEHPRKRTAQPTDQLTSHELHIARLVATGATSREVGARLYLSPRTIEAHLRSIFRKLGINSRRQLRELPLP
ncbi:ATP-binding protein [Microbacterium sp.]|uniref:ATP-binding protein n=2 Tax=Microbacterium sp. TaxID=51671 RepID=UPI0037CA4E0A